MMKCCPYPVLECPKCPVLECPKCPVLENPEEKPTTETPLERYMREQQEEQERQATSTVTEMVEAINNEEQKLREMERDQLLQKQLTALNSLTPELKNEYIEATAELAKLDPTGSLDESNDKFTDVMEKAIDIYKKIEVLAGPLIAAGMLITKPTPIGLGNALNYAMSIAMKRGEIKEPDPPDVIGAIRGIIALVKGRIKS